MNIEIAEPPVFAGLIIACIALAWNIVNIVRDRSRVRIEVSFANTGYFSGSPQWYLSITAINTGRRPVTLSSVGIRLSNHINLGHIPRDGEFPRKLEESESHDILMDLNAIKNNISQHSNDVHMKYAWFRDQTGKLHKRKLTKKQKQRILE